eukprot:scaffold36453_cov34-Phaeocystis_antarctica.AAC.2
MRVCARVRHCFPPHPGRVASDERRVNNGRLAACGHVEASGEATRRVNDHRAVGQCEPTNDIEGTTRLVDVS